MPRKRRVSVGGFCYHVINRGNGRRRVFLDEEDYARFISLVRRACVHAPMRILAWCLMPNHFHFVLWPSADGELSRWMHWLLTTHVVHHAKRHRTTGRIWQGRFKAFPIQDDWHLLRVLRYVERNALRADLVRRAESWPWGSLHARVEGRGDDLLDPGPLQRPIDWVGFVNLPQASSEVDAIRESAADETPYGAADWTTTTSERLGLTCRRRRRRSRSTATGPTPASFEVG